MWGQQKYGEFGIRWNKGKVRESKKDKMEELNKGVGKGTEEG